MHLNEIRQKMRRLGYDKNMSILCSIYQSKAGGYG